MAYIFKSIAATQFLSNMLFIYFFVNCNIFKFHNCVLLVQVEGGTCAHAQKLVSAVSILLGWGIEQYMVLQVWGSVGSNLVCT